MSQTNLIVAALLFSFFVFITIRGHLPQYLGLLLPSTQPAATPVSTKSDHQRAKELIDEAVRNAG